MSPIGETLLRLSALANDSDSLPLRLRPRRSKVACNAGAQCRASSDCICDRIILQDGGCDWPRYKKRSKRRGIDDAMIQNLARNIEHNKMATITQTLESANAEGKPIKLAVAYDDKVHNAVSRIQKWLGLYVL